MHETWQGTVYVTWNNHRIHAKRCAQSTKGNGGVNFKNINELRIHLGVVDEPLKV